jgi:competence protein ComEC
MVLLARYGERTFLLAGDIERRAEAALLTDPALAHIDVLKVAHHGSKTSTSLWFLQATTPWFALASAGFDNPYGHPHPDVVARLESARTRLLRTDRDGRITVATDGRRIFLSTRRWEHSARKPPSPDNF